MNLYLTLLVTLLASICMPALVFAQPDAAPGTIYKLKPVVRPFVAPLPAEFRYFMEVALGSEYGLGDFAVKKWHQDLAIEVIGQPTTEDMTTLERVIAELNELVGHAVHLHLVGQAGNVKLHFIPHNEFYHFEPNGIVFYGGFFWNWWNYSGEISDGRIVIASDRISQTLRSHLIREELTQVLGLMNDSNRFEDSIFYQGYSEIDKFSTLDRLVIKTLYSENISAGMLDFELQDVVLKTLEEQGSATYYQPQ